MNKGVPKYKLLKPFPGMSEPVGTIFCEYEGWGNCLGTESGRIYTGWVPAEFFEPYVGEFFERV